MGEADRRSSSLTRRAVLVRSLHDADARHEPRRNDALHGRADVVRRCSASEDVRDPPLELPKDERSAAPDRAARSRWTADRSGDQAATCSFPHRWTSDRAVFAAADSPAHVTQHQRRAAIDIGPVDRTSGSPLEARSGARARPGARRRAGGMPSPSRPIRPRQTCVGGGRIRAARRPMRRAHDVRFVRTASRNFSNRSGRRGRARSYTRRAPARARAHRARARSASRRSSPNESALIARFGRRFESERAMTSPTRAACASESGSEGRARRRIRSDQRVAESPDQPR